MDNKNLITDAALEQLIDEKVNTCIDTLFTEVHNAVKTLSGDATDFQHDELERIKALTVETIKAPLSKLIFNQVKYNL